MTLVKGWKPWFRKSSGGFLGTTLVLAMGLLILFSHWGCQGKMSPTAPLVAVRGLSLSFSMPISKEIKDSLLGVASNEVMYQVTGPNMGPVTGVAGPFSTATQSGELDFSIVVPQGASRLLSFQLNNASNHQPLALGAAQSDINAGGVSDIWVTMGSVVRNCYAVDTSSYGVSAAGVTTAYFTFQPDILSATPTGSPDLAIGTVGTGTYLLAALASNGIAYLGNGPIVNFDSTPVTSAFVASSTVAKQAAGVSPSYLQAGDVYCVSLGPAGANGHAWIQVVNPNQPFGLYPPGPTGPKFFFRVNTTLPYYAYDPTTADINGSCPAPPPTPTNVPTNTFTPTNSPTFTNSPTITDTPTITPTPSNTATTNTTIPPTNTFTPSPTFVPGYTVSSSLSCLLSDTNNGACQSFVLTIDANSNGNPAESYAYVADLTNGQYVWVGPWTYTGSGTSYSVTLTGGDFGVTTAIATSLAVTLYNTTESQVLGYAIPSGSPLTLEEPEEYFYNYYSSYNYLSCATTAEDGYCENFNFNTELFAPGSTPVTTLVKLTDLSNGVSVFLGPVTDTGGYYAGNIWNLSPQQFGVTTVGQQALSQVFTAQLIDAATDVILDAKALGSLNLEYPSTAIASSSVSCLVSDINNGACENFVLTIDANGPTGIPETSYAAVTDTTNGQYVWVGPWTYTGSGTSYSVTLAGGDFGVTTATAASLKVELYNESESQILDTSIPAGSPLTLESPEEYFYEYDYNSYNYLSCATTSEDGYCSNFSFQTYLYAPISGAVTSLIELTNLSNGVSVFLGPVTVSGGYYDYAQNTWNLSPLEFGVTIVGQQAASQLFEAQLIDAGTDAVLDRKPLGSLNLEYPSTAIASSSVSCLVSDVNNGACQSFVLTIDANGPAGVSETSYAAVTDTTNGQYLWVGPWTYSGSGTSYTVTLTGGDFGVTTAATASLQVELYNESKTQILDTSIPIGSPMTIEAPEEYFYEYYGEYNYLSCATTAEDGNCANFNFYSELYVPGTGPVTSLIEMTNLSNGVSMFLGPIVIPGSGYLANTWNLSPGQFGVSLVGQKAVSQMFEVQLIDNGSLAVLDSQYLGSLNLEYPSAYIASSSLSCLQTDVNNGACQSFILTIDANGPTGIPETSYATLTDLANNQYVSVGPWTYSGTDANSYSITLSGGNFGVTTPTAPPLKVSLYSPSGNLQDTAVPSGSPMTLETSQEYLYESYFSCVTVAEDGNCVTFNYNAYLDVPGSTPVTSYVKLVDLTTGASTMLGPVTNIGNQNLYYSVPLTGANFGLPSGQSAISQVFQAQLYDSTQTQVWDTKTTGVLNIENSSTAASLAGASAACLLSDSGNGACQSFVLTIDANSSGGPAESYAYVTNTTNNNSLWVGPWTYTGTGISYSVTLTAGDFGISTATAASLAVTLYNAAQNVALGNTVPTGLPVSLEAPEEYFYEYYSDYNNLSCATTAEDGNCSNFNFDTELYAPGASPVTSMVQLIDLSNGTTMFLGPITITEGYASNTWNFSAEQFGVTTVGQQAVSQMFEAQLIDNGSQAVLDAKALGSMNFEYPSSYIASSSVSCLVSDINNGACQSFVLSIDADAPTGNLGTSYAKVTDATNNQYVWVGPWNYTGSGTSYSVTLTGGDFGVTTATTTSLKVDLYDPTQTKILDTSVLGTPFQLESPEEYFYYYSYDSYNYLSCATTTEEGNCSNFNFYTELFAPSGSGPVTSLIELTNLSNGTTVFLGPVTDNGGYYVANTWNFSPQQFGVTMVGQQAVSQVFEAQLIDAASSAVLDARALGSLNLEYPGISIASSSVSCLVSDINNGACQSFVLTINADGSTGVPETSYAAVTDTTNNEYVWVGPWTYTGSGTSYSVTLTGGDFGVTTATTTSLKVTLYDESETKILDTATPGGSPFMLEAPEESFYEYYNEYNYLSCATTAEDESCVNFNFDTELFAPSGSGPVTSLIELTNLSNGTTVFLGPVTDNGGYYVANTWNLSPEQFGVTAVGQKAAGQVFLAQLVDAGTDAVVDTKPLGNLNLEFPSSYIASSGVSCLVSDSGNGACQNFLLTINANGPAGIPETSYAAVTDTVNNTGRWVGPWTYNGSGTSYSVTLSGGDFGVTTAITAPLKVTLYNQAQNQILDTSVPSGTPFVMESPVEYFYYNYSLSCLTNGEDGNCETFNFEAYLHVPGTTAVTSYLKVVDTTNGTSVFLGPVTLAAGAYNYFNYTLSASQFGLSVGQAVSGQVFQAQLYDSTQLHIYDTEPLGTLGLEVP